MTLKDDYEWEEGSNLGKRRPWIIWRYWHVASGKLQEASIRIADSPAKIRTWYTPNRNPKRYRYIILLSSGAQAHGWLHNFPLCNDNNLSAVRCISDVWFLLRGDRKYGTHFNSYCWLHYVITIFLLLKYMLNLNLVGGGRSNIWINE
jgi:hypothetical protein